MQFSGQHFIYDGINSRRYGLKFLHIDTEPFKKVSGTPTYQKNFYNSTKSNSIIGIKWDESPIDTEVEFISDKPISKKEKRKIEKWLFNRPQYCKLYINKREDKEIEVVDGKELQCYVECVFYEPEIIEFPSGVHGFKAKMELASPFAMQDKIKKTIISNSNNEATEFDIYIDTDDNDYVYPIITFENESDCNINTIENLSDNGNTFSLSNLSNINILANNTIQVNSALLMITATQTEDNIQDYLTNQYFPRLCNGENKLKIYGHSTVSLEYSQKRFIR